MKGIDIHLWRRHRRVTQAQLAARFGVTRQTIANWERDKTRPPIDIECRLRMFDCIDAGLVGKTADGETIYGPLEDDRGNIIWRRYHELAWKDT